MCLIALAYDVHPVYRVILAANRDEFHDRPTLAIGPWSDAPRIIAGRDLRSGGTWLGVTPDGRWAAVTNVRGLGTPPPDPTSRGSLVSGFLQTDTPPPEYLDSILERAHAFDGFNLLVGDNAGVWWLSNHAEGGYKRVAPGIHGISNHLLDTPWPKVVRAKGAMAELMEREELPETGVILDLLMDRAYAADHELPATGVSPELERALSAPFIATPDYGTRSSSALLIRRDGQIYLAERTFDPAGTITGERRFDLGPSASG